MWEKALVVSGYLAVLLGIGFWARRRARRTAEDYFVASRSLPPLVLFLTMAATNFSAFTVFGFSGAGWRIGYSFYPIMAFGTGFMALSFAYIDRSGGWERRRVFLLHLSWSLIGSQAQRFVCSFSG